MLWFCSVTTYSNYPLCVCVLYEGTYGSFSERPQPEFRERDAEVKGWEIILGKLMQLSVLWLSVDFSISINVNDQY